MYKSTLHKVTTTTNTNGFKGAVRYLYGSLKSFALSNLTASLFKSRAQSVIFKTHLLIFFPNSLSFHLSDLNDCKPFVPVLKIYRVIRPDVFEISTVSSGAARLLSRENRLSCLPARKTDDKPLIVRKSGAAGDHGFLAQIAQEMLLVVINEHIFTLEQHFDDHRV